MPEALLEHMVKGAVQVSGSKPRPAQASVLQTQAKSEHLYCSMT